MNLRHTFCFITAVLFLPGAFCTHDTDIPLNNAVPVVDSPPGITNFDTLRKTLYYPEDIVCTLAVSDLNDSVLIIDSYWPGSFVQLNRTLDVKNIVLSINGATDQNVMGVYSGDLVIVDERYEGRDTLPYVISRIFKDPIDLLNVQSKWALYSGDDAALVYEWFDVATGAVRGVNLELSASIAATGNNLVGFASKFCLQGDFCFTIAYDFREGMTDSFETAIFIGDDSIAEPFAEAGIRFVAAASGLQTVLFGSSGISSGGIDPRKSLGSLKFERTLDEVSIYHSPPPYFSYQLMGKTTVDVDVVYLHAYLKVERKTGSGIKSCKMGNLVVSKGSLLFQ